MKKLSRVFVLVLAISAMLLSACGATAAVSDSASTSDGGSKPQAMPVEFTGLIEAINGDQWTVGGQTVTVDPSVVRDGPFKVGDAVKVEVQVQTDGSMVVSRVEAPVLDPNSNDANSNDINSNDANINDANSNDVNSNDANSNDVNSNDSNINDANSNNANINDANSNDDNSNDSNLSNGNSNDNNSNDDKGGDNKGSDDKGGDDKGGSDNSGGGSDDSGGDN
jgi:hypothetical protein